MKQKQWHMMILTVLILTFSCSCFYTQKANEKSHSDTAKTNKTSTFSENSQGTATELSATQTTVIPGGDTISSHPTTSETDSNATTVKTNTMDKPSTKSNIAATKNTSASTKPATTTTTTKVVAVDADGDGWFDNWYKP